MYRIHLPTQRSLIKGPLIIPGKKIEKRKCHFELFKIHKIDTVCSHSCCVFFHLLNEPGSIVGSGWEKYSAGTLVTCGNTTYKA